MFHRDWMGGLNFPANIFSNCIYNLRQGLNLQISSHQQTHNPPILTTHVFSRCERTSLVRCGMFLFGASPKWGTPICFFFFPLWKWGFFHQSIHLAEPGWLVDGRRFIGTSTMDFFLYLVDVAFKRFGDNGRCSIYIYIYIWLVLPFTDPLRQKWSSTSRYI